MKLLLDECVDTRLAAHIAAFKVGVVRTVHDQGWSGISNGKLLNLAQAEFDVFVTVDRNLSFQQHLTRFTIAVVLLRARSNRVDDLVALVPTLIAKLPTVRLGLVTTVELPAIKKL